MAEVLSGKRLQILNFIADCQREQGLPALGARDRRGGRA